MFKPAKKRNIQVSGRQAGFTLIEALVSLLILVVVAAIVMSGMVQLTKAQGTIANRTQLHSSVRSATELLEQEIGQSGIVSLPAPAPGAPWVMTTAVNVPADLPVTLNNVQFNLANGLFDNENLVVDTGLNQETITLTCPVPGTCTNTWTATFNNSHAANVPIAAMGAFAAGIVPPTTLNGSSATVLKLYGDINGDGNMLYIEYTCDIANNTLWRNWMPFNQAGKTNANKLALLGTIQQNPNDQFGNPVPCFSYQTKTVGLAPQSVTFVTDVAITLTEQTQFRDPQSNQFQQETKALLNVSPRNVFNAWELDSADLTNRVQPTPLSVTNLLYP